MQARGGLLGGAGLLDHGHELLGRAGALQERVLQQLLGAGAVVDLLDEALVDKVLKVRRPLFGLLERRDALGGDEEERTQRRELHVRRLALGHLHDHDAQTPNVDLGAVVVASNQLRRHPVGGLHERARERARARVCE